MVARRIHRHRLGDDLGRRGAIDVGQGRRLVGAGREPVGERAGAGRQLRRTGRGIGGAGVQRPESAGELADSGGKAVGAGAQAAGTRRQLRGAPGELADPALQSVDARAGLRDEGVAALSEGLEPGTALGGERVAAGRQLLERGRVARGELIGAVGEGTHLRSVLGDGLLRRRAGRVCGHQLRNGGGE